MTFILITYLYGWLQLRPLLRMKPSDNTTVQQSKKKAHVLRLIAQTAITLSALSVVFMVCVITYAIMLIRNVPVSPVSQTPNIFSGLFEECSCWMQVVVMRYCYLSVSNKQGSSSANHVPKTTGDTAAGSVSASRVAEGKMSVKLVSPAHAVTAPSSVTSVSFKRSGFFDICITFMKWNGERAGCYSVTRATLRRETLAAYLHSHHKFSCPSICSATVRRLARPKER